MAAGASDRFLDALSPDEVAHLKRRGVLRRFPRGTALFHEREVSDRVYHLVPDDFDPAAAYAVSGTGIAAVNGPSVVLEQLDAADPDLATLLSTAGITAPGLTIRIQAADGTAAGAGFSVQVDRVGGAT